MSTKCCYIYNKKLFPWLVLLWWRISMTLSMKITRSRTWISFTYHIATTGSLFSDRHTAIALAQTITKDHFAGYSDESSPLLILTTVFPRACPFSTFSMAWGTWEKVNSSSTTARICRNRKCGHTKLKKSKTNLTLDMCEGAKVRIHSKACYRQVHCT